MSSAVDTRPRPEGPQQETNNATQIWRTRFLIRQLQFMTDGAVLLAAFTLAFLLRFDFAIPGRYASEMWVQLPFVVLIQFGALIFSGVYSFIWRYIGLAEVKAFLKAALWSLLPLLFMRYYELPAGINQVRVPLSVIIIDTCLAYGGVLGLRVLRRAFYEHYEKQTGSAIRPVIERKSVLLIGAGRAGVMVAKEILGRGDAELRIKGFVDDDPNKQRAIIQGVRVLGTTQDLPQLVAEHGISHIVISIARASRNDFRRILNICEQIPVKVQVIPSLSEIVHGRVNISRIRDIEIEDLLGREPVRLEEDSMTRLLSGKRVMVTGAGGSIGSDLARQVARLQPAALLLVERAEFALFNIERELRQSFPGVNIVPLIADVGNEHRMRHIFAAFHPSVVFHAAAHKHVPLMEINPAEAVKNNILATHLLGGLAGEFGVEVFVLISTDKAVRPSSVMGASKRVSELVIQTLNRRYQTRYLAVRFGNVIGSAGSVIPIFRDQIRRGGPVTVTHPDMVRYFMTIPEATQLVIQAGAIGEGGEIFILDMGEPVRILDLARETINLSGLRPYEDIDIVFTGIRPGEKLFEELVTTEEEATRTRHPKIFIGKITPYPDGVVRRALARLNTLAERGDERELRVFLNELLPEARLVSPSRPEQSSHSWAAAAGAA